MFKTLTQGAVSISTTDCLTGRWTILPCYLSIAEWSDDEHVYKCIQDFTKIKTFFEALFNMASFCLVYAVRDRIFQLSQFSNHKNPMLTMMHYI